VRFTRAELPSPVSPLPFVAELPGGWPEWLADSGNEAGTPFLMSPSLELAIANIQRLTVENHRLTVP
jgi:hypothetical protein